MQYSNLERRFPRPTIGALLFIVLFSAGVYSQDRDRVVKKPEKAAAREAHKKAVGPEQGLTDEIVITKDQPSPKSLVKKTASSALTANAAVSTASYFSATVRSMMLNSIKQKIGIRYRYGTQGPSRYDCSGFVWKVFRESGLPFTRTSAAQYWRTFEPVTGDERYQFGTLVFFNRLGHVGIVAGRDGFYHASSSKGITYSKFKGYWEKRIVGFRRIPLSALIIEGVEK